MNQRLIVLPLLLAACVESTPRSSTDSSSAPRTAPVVTSVRVNQATSGMMSRVKWMLSADSSAILAVVDPSGVENEAIPNGFFYGSESQNFQARMDSVWDVAPSPDWKTIAFSRAYVLNPRELDSIPPNMWQDVARKTGMDTATVRTGSFPSSGMSMARAIAQPGTIKVPADARTLNASDDAAPHFYPVALGWRVRWTTDGNFIALGNSPATVRDDAPSETWASLDPGTGAFHPSLPGDAKTVTPKWIQGPKLELAVPVDVQGAPAMSIAAGGRHFSIETVRGVISAREIGSPSDSTGRTYTIGSGKLLAATKSGRFILALAPRANAVANEMPVEAVVYIVGW
jgi:hypothetical protein